MKLYYHWHDAPDGSHVAVNYAIREDGIAGSVRRWSRDRTVNSGSKFTVAPAAVVRGADGRASFAIDAGAERLTIPIDPSAATEADWIRATAA